jgi:hypothetical protein
MERFINENKTTSLVVVYEHNYDNKLHYKTFKFNSINEFIKTTIIIFDMSIRRPKLYISNKYKRYTNMETIMISNFIYNIYIQRHKIYKLVKPKH